MFNILGFFVFNIIVAFIIWAQTVSPVKFPQTLSKYPYLFYAVSLVAGFFFIESSKLGFKIFTSAWSIRFLGFSINTIMFFVLTNYFMNEKLDTKNTICLVLAILIIVVQVVLKD